MTKKSIMLKNLLKFFTQEGKVFTLSEYSKHLNTPVRPVFIKRVLGGWPRVLALMAHNYPEEFAKIGEVKEVKAAPVVKPAPAVVKETPNNGPKIK